MQAFRTPFYDLKELQKRFRNPNTRLITRRCFKNAVAIGFSSEQEIVEVVLKLKERHLYKTMESRKIPGLWQDVYHLKHKDLILYIKLQKSFDDKGVVIQLKEK